MWNNLSRLLFIATLALGALAAYLYFGWGAEQRQARQEQEDKAREVVLENERLKEHVVYLTNRLEQDVAKISKEKEEEIARVKSTHDEMTKALQKEVELGQIKVTQLADRLSLNIVDKILFPSGEDQISDEGKAVLKRVGDVLFQAKGKTFRIEGHTDNVPPGRHIKNRFPSNWELSTARATNVVRFLQESTGIDPANLEAVGLGEYHPIATNNTPAGRSQNRRIEIILFPSVRALTRDLNAGRKADGPRTPLAPVPAK